MTKTIPKGAVVCVFPLSGKSTAARRFKNVVDLESSRYMFEDSLIDSKYNGDEEAAKGDPTRIRLEDANERYLEAILVEVNNPEHDYVIAGPTALKDLMDLELAGELARPLYLVQPEWRDSLVEELHDLSVGRGNSQEWRDAFLPHVERLYKLNLNAVKPERLIILKPGQFLSDVISGLE